MKILFIIFLSFFTLAYIAIKLEPKPRDRYEERKKASGEPWISK